MKYTGFMARQAGDTIVEVLIAIVIISTILTGAFAVSQHSVKAVRDSQEHAEVAQLLQGQIEMLRSAAEKSSPDVFSAPAVFCLTTDSSNNIAIVPITSGVSNYAGYPPQCKLENNLYNINIQYNSSANTFTATANWDSITGSPAQEQLVYSAYKAS